MSSYSSHKEYFEQNYTNGSDVWSHNTYTQEFLSFARLLPHRGTVLDLGSGRGHMSFLLADLGMKVIGLDYIQELTEKNNSFVKERGYVGKVAFKTGDIFNIPFQENSFHSVVDIGTFHHVHPVDWHKYAEEVFRVLQPSGHLLLVELSKKTERFLSFKPQEEITGNFEYENLFYHFFDKKEIEEIFSFGFSLIKSETHVFPDMNNHAFIFTLLKKK